MMEVQLYVYDLTHGMARSMSRQFLGIQIDAVYHTALVFNNVEYFFGMGVQTCLPGATHHGRPMEIISLGTTHLPMETVLDYLENLKQIYTAESYDLFAHNCNNFTNDFAMFLVGRGIPDHITSLPKRVLETPFGQMLKPQIDASMRSITQAPVPPQNMPARPQSNNTLSAGNSTKASTNGAANGTSTRTPDPYGKVVIVTSLENLEKHLQTAASTPTAATVFFTSSTCAPCRVAYPTFDSLAEQFPQALFVKVDINSARDVASRYRVQATPTFTTFSKGVKQDEWSGADTGLLKSNVERLMRQTFPPHPHTLLKLPKLQFGSLKPIVYAKVPPLEKLMRKLGPAQSDQQLQALCSFVQKRGQDPREATLPNLPSIAQTFRDQVTALPVEVRFAAIDLLRCSMVDPRVSGFFAEETGTRTVYDLITHVTELEDCPHNLRLVTIHLACNLFTSPIYVKELMRSGNELTAAMIQLLTSSLLDASHPTTRTSAGSLAFNLASANYRLRREEDREAIAEAQQVELAASLVEALSSEENGEAAKSMLLALGYLAYCAPQDGELLDLCRALDARQLLNTRDIDGLQALAKEVGALL